MDYVASGVRHLIVPGAAWRAGTSATGARACGSHFTDTCRGGKPPAVKALAVLKWVRAEAAGLPEPEVASSVVTVQVDEMRHHLEKSLPSSGSGAPMTWISG